MIQNRIIQIVNFGRIRHGKFRITYNNNYQIPSEDKEKIKSAEEKIRFNKT